MTRTARFDGGWPVEPEKPDEVWAAGLLLALDNPDKAPADAERFDAVGGLTSTPAVAREVEAAVVVEELTVAVVVVAATVYSGWMGAELRV